MRTLALVQKDVIGLETVLREFLLGEMHRHYIGRDDPVFEDVGDAEIWSHMWPAVKLGRALSAKAHLPRLANCDHIPVWRRLLRYGFKQHCFDERCNPSLRGS